MAKPCTGIERQLLVTPNHLQSPLATGTASASWSGSGCRASSVG